ncbi:MAG: lipoate--protein ligase family protein [Thermodesulfovibrionaceae bacterium]
MVFRFIDSGKIDPFLNMAIDEAISISVREGKSPPTIRFYEWDGPALTVGEFQRIEEININFCNLQGIPIVRRPTGGKGILHLEDLTYSISSRKEGVFSDSLFRTYEIIAKIFVNAFNLQGITTEIKKEKRVVNRTSLCFARSSFGEICYRDIKILGSAQKRWKEGFLQQGTMPIFVNKALLKEVFLLKDEELSSVFGIKEIFPDFDIMGFKNSFKLSLIKEGFDIIEDSLRQDELLIAKKLLLEKYKNSYWTYKQNGSFKD